MPDPRSSRGKRADALACPVWRVRATAPGTYVFVLEVVAGRGETRRRATSAAVSVTVGRANRPPLAALFPPRPKVERGEWVTVDASRSRDPDGDKLDYIWGWSHRGRRPRHWVFDGPRAQFLAEEEGAYGIQLIVSDGASLSEPADARVEVGAANRPPEVRVPRLVEALVGQTVRVAARAEDPDQDAMILEWKVFDAPEVLPPDLLKRNPLVFVPRRAGMYVLRAVAGDGRASGSAEVQVAVGGDVHLPPTAVVSGPEEATPGQEVVLSAERSRDPAGRRLTYRWRQVETAGGPRLAELPPPATCPRWRFTPHEPGEYLVALSASNGVLESEPHLWRLRAAIETPVEDGAADAEPPRAEPPPKPGAPLARMVFEDRPPFYTGQTVRLSARKSSDPLRRDLSCHWRQTEGELLEFALGDSLLSVAPRGSGRHVLELRVKGGEDESTPARTAFDAQPGAAPEAAIAPFENVAAGEKLLLDGSPSRDPNGWRLEYRWRILSQPEGARISPTVHFSDYPKVELTPPRPGGYGFELRVYNGLCWSRPRTVSARVREANLPPVAHAVALTGFTPADLRAGADLLSLPHVFSDSPLVVERGEEVILDAGPSRDPDRYPRPLVFSWRQVSGPRVSDLAQEGARLKFTACDAGKIVCQLTAHDGLSPSAAAEAAVVVLERGRLPVAEPRVYLAGPKDEAPADPPARKLETTVFPRQGETPGERPIVLDGRASRAAAGGTLQYLWRQTGGEDLGLPPDRLSRPALKLRIFAAGTYIFTLTVFDGEHHSRPAKIEVAVKEAKE
jgi:hypothetical protein